MLVAGWLGVAAWWVWRPDDAALPAPEPPDRPDVHGVSEPVRPPRPDPGGPGGASPFREGAWIGAVDEVGRACDLDLARACDGRGCAALARVPRLDTPWGWVRLGRRSPALVAAVVAGDLGLPDRALPCRASIRALSGTTLARAHGDGELWCAVDRPSAAALCDRLAAEATGAPAGFAAGADRVVELRPPGT